MKSLAQSQDRRKQYQDKKPESQCKRENTRKGFSFLVDTGFAITIVSSSAFIQLKSLDSGLEEIQLADGK